MDEQKIVKFEDWFNPCPACASLDTAQVAVRYPSCGVEVDRHCNACGKDWQTKVYDNDYLDDVAGDFDDHNREDAYEAALAECGMTQDGGCMLAGTEFCDWDCPINWEEDDEAGASEVDGATH